MGWDVRGHDRKGGGASGRVENGRWRRAGLGGFLLFEFGPAGALGGGDARSSFGAHPVSSALGGGVGSSRGMAEAASQFSHLALYLFELPLVTNQCRL